MVQGLVGCVLHMLSGKVLKCRTKMAYPNWQKYAPAFDLFSALNYCYFFTLHSWFLTWLSVLLSNFVFYVRSPLQKRFQSQWGIPGWIKFKLKGRNLSRILNPDRLAWTINDHYVSLPVLFVLLPVPQLTLPQPHFPLRLSEECKPHNLGMVRFLEFWVKYMARTSFLCSVAGLSLYCL